MGLCEGESQVIWAHNPSIDMKTASNADCNHCNHTYTLGAKKCHNVGVIERVVTVVTPFSHAKDHAEQGVTTSNPMLKKADTSDLKPRETLYSRETENDRY